jgi:hypothetical protein
MERDSPQVREERRMALDPHEQAVSQAFNQALVSPTDEFLIPELPAAYVIDDAVIEDNRLGQLLLRHRLVTLEQLESCLDEHQATPGALLGEVLISRNLVTADDIQNILKLQLNELRLGQILVKIHTITQEQLDIALMEQDNTGELLGSILIGFGFCTPEQINWALDLQNKE